ncbi:MAG: SDR family oxidoreductase [Proteobacteria bacterium]|nr:SDR family oxidoreductase [Pseudomonadota bacterium]
MTRSSLFDLTGKVALITGSSRGIGKAIAEAMAEAGARVVISSRKAEICQTVARELKERGLDAIAVPCNVSSKEELQRLVDATIARWERIDILVCNAATNPVFGPASQVPDSAFDKVMGTNVRSTFWLCNMVIPQMAARRDGAVILLASIAGLKGNGVIGTYGISKAAEMQLARNLAVEWGPHNVRVNSIAPGVVKTDFARALWEDPERRERTEARAPLRRIGEPRDIAGIAVFLAAAAGAFVTGQVIVADGGATIAETL